MLTNQTTYSPYCSELINREILLSCRAKGDPEPTIDIYIENDNGSQYQLTEEYQRNGELVVSLLPMRYGDNAMIHCNISNIASFVSISVNLTYTCKCFVFTYTYILMHMYII